MPIQVFDVLDLLASGLSRDEILAEMPALEPEDVEACLQFASRVLNHPAVLRGELVAGIRSIAGTGGVENAFTDDREPRDDRVT